MPLLLSNKKQSELFEKPKAYKNISSSEMNKLKEQILNSYNSQDPWGNKGKVLPYLINKQCKMLIECIEEFI